MNDSKHQHLKKNTRQTTCLHIVEPNISQRSLGLCRRKPARRGRVAGFTIVELMIALLLSFLVVAAAIGIFEANQRTLLEKQRIDSEQDAFRYSTNLLTRLIRNADEVLGGSNGTSLVLRTNFGQGIFDCLGEPRFAPAPPADPADPPSAEFFDMTLSFDSQPNNQAILRCSVDGGDPRVLVRSVPSGRFQYASAPSPDANGVFLGGFGAFSTTPGGATPTLAVRVAFTAPADQDLLLTAVLRPQVVALDAGAN